MKEMNVSEDKNISAKLLKGAAVLSLAAIITKVLGMLQKIPLQNIGGDGVFGIYNTVYPIYTIMITLTTAGFQAAAAKFVAEQQASGNEDGKRRVLRMTSWLMLILGIAGWAMMYFGAPVVAGWIGSDQLIPSLRAAAPALLFFPLCSSLRGYFQGLQDMVPTGVSQVMDQGIRVAVMIGLILYLTNVSAPDAVIAGGALAGSTAGAAVGLLTMLWFWHRERKRIHVVSFRSLSGAGKVQREGMEQEQSQGQPHVQGQLQYQQGLGQANEQGESQALQESGQAYLQARTQVQQESGQAYPQVQTQEQTKFQAETTAQLKGSHLMRAIVRYALPICVSALAVPLISLVDTFTLPRLLADGNVGNELAVMAEIGVYNRGIPLVQLVTMIASSLSILFIPAMADLTVRGDQPEIKKQIQLSLRWFWLIGLAASLGLAALAEPINIMLYENAQGTDAMVWIAWTAAPGAMVAVTAALLQGLGAVGAPALHLLGAALLKTALNALLVPQLGIAGAAIAGVCAYAAAAALNAALLLRRTGLRLRLRDALLRPAAAVLAMAAAVLLLRLGAAGLAGAAALPPGRALAAAESLAGVLLGAAVFAAAVLRLRLLSATEIAALPRIGPKLLKALRLLRLLP